MVGRLIGLNSKAELNSRDGDHILNYKGLSPLSLSSFLSFLFNPSRPPFRYAISLFVLLQNVFKCFDIFLILLLTTSLARFTEAKSKAQDFAEENHIETELTDDAIMPPVHQSPGSAEARHTDPKVAHYAR